MEIVAGEPEDPGSPRSGGSTVGTGSDSGAAPGQVPAAKPSKVPTWNLVPVLCHLFGCARGGALLLRLLCFIPTSF